MIKEDTTQYISQWVKKRAYYCDYGAIKKWLQNTDIKNTSTERLETMIEATRSVSTSLGGARVIFVLRANKEIEHRKFKSGSIV